MYTLCILCTHYNHVPICTHECVRCSLFLLLLNIQYIFGLWFISVAFISLSLCVCVCVWFLFGLHLRMLQYLGFLSRNLYAYHHRRSLYRGFSSSPFFSLSFWSLKCLPYGPRRSHTTLSLHELFLRVPFSIRLICHCISISLALSLSQTLPVLAWSLCSHSPPACTRSLALLLLLLSHLII